MELYARDLVSEPEIFYTQMNMRKNSSLKKIGLKINIFDKKIEETWYECITRCRYGKH